MIATTTLITYSAIVLGVVLIPGPSTLLTVARSASSGPRIGMATGVGVAVGDMVHTFMAIVGISAIMAASATLFSIVKYAGAAYLIYLGIQSIFSKKPVDTNNSNELPITAKQAFRQGLMTEVLNPKTALFFLAFLPQFTRIGAGAIAAQLAILGVVFVSLGFLSTMLYAVSAGRLGSFIRRNPSALKWQGKIVGSIYCALGIRLALQER